MSFDQNTRGFRVVHSITEIAQATWDALVSPVVQASHGWLKTIEETTTYSVQFLYLLLETDAFLEGAALAYIPSDGLSPSLDDPVFGRMKGCCTTLGLSFEPSLICGGLKTDGAHVFVSSSIHEPHRSQVFHLIIDEMERYALARRLSVSFLDVLAIEEPLLRILGERGYYKTTAAPKTQLNICWTTFDEYLRHVKANSCKTVHNEINRTRTMGTDVQRVSLEGMDELVFDLLQKHHATKTDAPFPHKADFVDVLRANLDANLLFYAATKANHLVGAALMLRMGSVGWMPFAAIDRARTQNDFAYFSLAYYAPIADAIRGQLKTLFYGAAPYHPKLRRGFHLVNCFLLYKPTGRLGAFATPICFAVHRYRQRLRHKGAREMNARYFESSHQ